MKTIDIPASYPYSVEIGSGLLDGLGEKIRAVCPKAERVVMVSDDSVCALHGERTLYVLRNAGFDSGAWTLTHGERSKSAQNLIALLNSLASYHISRSDALVALGGGVIGDITGLAAAVYMRGISYFQVPTTLLAAVDSSVGGKTAVDLGAGKNLMGAFWQPGHVLCDTDLLVSLPEKTFTEGCAEVIKTAILFDPELFSILERDGKAFDRESVIARCVEHKRDIVAEDEFDTGRRSLLNLGHTFAHALEACSNYTMAHGEAVAIGMAVVCRAAAKAGICDTEVPQRVCALLTKFGLPTHTNVPLEQLWKPMLSDKKRTGNTVKIVVPEKIGQCSFRIMDAQELQAFMSSGV